MFEHILQVGVRELQRVYGHFGENYTEVEQITKQ